MAITIADVAAAVPAGSAIDQIAYAIGSTFYSLEGSVVRPMLPPAISEDTASLIPGKPRRGVTLFISPDGHERFGLSWITVAHSFTYDTFVGSTLITELGIQKDPHIWIEELMIRYNSAAASLLKKASVGLLRVQPPADAEKVSAWLAIDPALAYEAASYEPANADADQAHATLGLAAYCHASSPLRRYADLVNQRAIHALLASDSATRSEILVSTHLNTRIQATRRWARDLTFLTQVTPGRVHEIDVVWASETHVWVPAWRRLIRLRHEEIRATGSRGKIRIFCDPTRRNWKQRVLTSETISDKSSQQAQFHPILGA
jgi:exoribonuclease R